jgi:hypothetical protein
MDRLETGIRRYNGDDLPSLTLDEFNKLSQSSGLEYPSEHIRDEK